MITPDSLLRDMTAADKIVLRDLNAYWSHLSLSFNDVFIVRIGEGKEAKTGLCSFGRELTANYRQAVSADEWRRTPVGQQVYAYYLAPEIDAFISRVQQHGSPVGFLYGNERYQFWKLDEACCSELLALMKGVGELVLLSAPFSADDLKVSTCLYFPYDQVNILSLHWVIGEMGECKVKDLVFNLARHYFISALPANKMFFPSRHNRVGFFAAGSWYQLDLKQEIHYLAQIPDTVFLQNRIFSGQLPLSLTSFQQAEMTSFLEALKSDEVVGFTFYPPSRADLMVHNASTMPFSRHSFSAGPAFSLNALIPDEGKGVGF